MRLLRRFPPRNDTFAHVIARAQPEAIPCAGREDEIATSFSLLAMTTLAHVIARAQPEAISYAGREDEIATLVPSSQ